MGGPVLHECVPLSARISEQVCAGNRKRGVWACEKCNGLGPAVEVPVAVEPPNAGLVARGKTRSRKVQEREIVRLTFVGDGAKVVQAMQALVTLEGTGPLEELLLDAMRLELASAGVTVGGGNG